MTQTDNEHELTQIISHMEWRYATKAYDSSRTLRPEDKATLEGVAQLSPTSFGLQPIQLLWINDNEVRQQLRQASYNQSQLTDAAEVLVLCSMTAIPDDFIDNYMDLIAATRSSDRQHLNGFGDHIKQFVAARTPSDLQFWTAKQCYILLGHLMQTAAELHIDSTPMEGFNASEYDRILGLHQRGLTASVVCTFGYRSPDDKYQYLKKVRRSVSELFETI